jgi:hypothetical protein
MSAYLVLQLVITGCPSNLVRKHKGDRPRAILHAALSSGRAFALHVSGQNDFDSPRAILRTALSPGRAFALIVSDQNDFDSPRATLRAALSPGRAFALIVSDQNNFDSPRATLRAAFSQCRAFALFVSDPDACAENNKTGAAVSRPLSRIHASHGFFLAATPVSR